MTTLPSPRPEGMDNRTALHTAARRFCEDRFDEWTTAYGSLKKKEDFKTENLFKPGWDYSAEAYDIFPRYRLDKAVRVEVERLRPLAITDLEELRSLLLRAGDIAARRLGKELKNEIATRAVREESEDYRAYILGLTEGDLRSVKPLPHRRVLTDEESKALWDQVKEAWSIRENYWFPLAEGPIPPNLLALHVDYFSSMKGPALLRGALAQRGVSRVFELNEFNPDEPDCEIELSIFEPAYRFGGEQYCTSTGADWIVYASHESSITIGGEWLTQLLKEKWPDCTERTYGGPYSTNDLRGTWNWE